MNRFKMKFYHRTEKRIYDVAVLCALDDSVSVIKFRVNLSDGKQLPEIEVMKMADGELIQFTGKPDRNQKDIYAGDEVLFGEDQKGFVEWNSKRLKWQIRYNENSLIDLGEIDSAYLSIVGSKCHGEFYGHN